MRSALALAALGSLLACGPAPSDGLGFDIGLSAAVADQLTEFQISVLPAALPEGGRLECATVRTSCASGLDHGRFLKLRDPNGKEVLAVRFAAELQPGTPRTQEVRVGGIPVGREYAVLVEGLSATQLLASSCSYVTEIEEGDRNPTLVTSLVELTPPPACEPRF